MKSQLATKLDDVEVRYEYTTVFNGLSVEADYADLETIQDLPGVKDAYVSQIYQLIEPVNETKLADSVPSIGGDISQKTGYTGKGMVVAILDTGLDTSHEAFQNNVNGAKYTKNDIQAKILNNKLHAGEISVDSVYKSSKIPFAYDYSEPDTNVAGGNSHGTHVAGIVGANGGKVTGVAPDAQLMILKIFGDDGSGAYDSDILAALDDAVMLGRGCDQHEPGSDSRLLPGRRDQDAGGLPARQKCGHQPDVRSGQRVQLLLQERQRHRPAPGLQPGQRSRGLPLHLWHGPVRGQHE